MAPVAYKFSEMCSTLKEDQFQLATPDIYVAHQILSLFEVTSPNLQFEV